MRFMFAAVTVVCVLGMAVTGCGKKSEAPAKKSRPTIAVIPKGSIHEFWKSVHAGAVKAGRELGVEVIWRAPLKEDDREAQVAAVEDMIARGVTGIVLAPLDDTALRIPVANAVRAGIPVVIMDSGLRGSDFASYVATDNFEAGRIAGKHVGDLLNGKGKVAVLRYSEGHDSTTKREDGFLDGISQFKDIEVISSDQYSGVTTESAVSAAENLFMRFGGGEGKLEIEGIFCAAEPVTLGILRALKNMGASGQVKFVGFDASDTMIDALRKGELHGFVVQNPMKIGSLAVETMVQHLQGKQVEARIDTGCTLITPENVDDPEIAELIRPDLAKWLSPAKTTP